jgi:hypothetical protein
MATRTWEVVKVRYCDHIGQEVTLEAETVYPADILPEQPPRYIAHRCSSGIDCMVNDKPSCVWSGSNPLYDPFF